MTYSEATNYDSRLAHSFSEMTYEEREGWYSYSKAVADAVYDPDIDYSIYYEPEHRFVNTQ